MSQRPRPVAAAPRTLDRLGGLLGRRTAPEDRDLDRVVKDHLAGCEKPAGIAVLAAPGRSRTDALATAVRRTARVLRADATVHPARRAVELAAHGRFDLVVVDAPPGLSLRLLDDVVFHVRPGGLVVFRGVPGEKRRRLVRRLRGLARGRDGGRESSTTGRQADDVRALAQAIRGWRVVGPHVVVECGATAFAKLRYDEVDDLLAGGDSPRGRVVARVPAARFVARCEVTQNASELRRAEVREIDAPSVALREYRDVTCFPRQVVVQDAVLLPDTYRHSTSRRLRSTAVHDLAPRFAGLRGPATEPRFLPGTYVLLDSEFPGHYGHLVTEQLSRMWAWPHVLEVAARPRVLLGTVTPRTTLHPHERELLGAFGVGEDDVVLFDEQVRVERLLSAAPMFEQPAFVHPEVADTWRRAGEALAARAPARPYPRRIFCARRTDKRSCHNAREVEQAFVERGFTIVHTEDHPLPEQAALFRSADVIAGYAGAAMFNLCYTDRAKEVLMLVSESYTAQNEYLMAAVQGHRLTIVWCPADVPIPARGFSAEAYQSSYTFDVERDGAWLEDRLDALG